jgi:hypothetical protein
LNHEGFVIGARPLDTCWRIEHSKGGLRADEDGIATTIEAFSLRDFGEGGVDLPTGGGAISEHRVDDRLWLKVGEKFQSSGEVFGIAVGDEEPVELVDSSGSKIGEDDVLVGLEGTAIEKPIGAFASEVGGASLGEIENRELANWGRVEGGGFEVNPSAGNQGADLQDEEEHFGTKPIGIITEDSAEVPEGGSKERGDAENEDGEGEGYGE